MEILATAIHSIRLTEDSLVTSQQTLIWRSGSQHIILFTIWEYTNIPGNKTKQTAGHTFQNRPPSHIWDVRCRWGWSHCYVVGNHVRIPVHWKTTRDTSHKIQSHSTYTERGSYKAAANRPPQLWDTWVSRWPCLYHVLKNYGILERCNYFTVRTRVDFTALQKHHWTCGTNYYRLCITSHPDESPSNTASMPVSTDKRHIWKHTMVGFWLHCNSNWSHFYWGYDSDGEKLWKYKKTWRSKQKRLSLVQMNPRVYASSSATMCGGLQAMLIPSSVLLQGPLYSNPQFPDWGQYPEDGRPSAYISCGWSPLGLHILWMVDPRPTNPVDGRPSAYVSSFLNSFNDKNTLSTQIVS
jgi:hypothetical protein